MNIEEAKEDLKFSLKAPLHGGEHAIVTIKSLETVLSELEKKDKVINEMATYIDQLTNELVSETGNNNLKCCESKECLDNGDLECKDCIIKYYTNKVEREGK